MAIMFAVRGDSMTARYSGGSNYAAKQGSPSVVSDAGSLGGNRIDLITSGNLKAIFFEARNNVFAGRTFSVLCRIKSNYTGAPAASTGFFNIGVPTTGYCPTMGIHHHTTGTLRAHCQNEAFQTSLSEASHGSWSPTANTRYDLVWTWDGTTTASASKIYVDASLLGSVTASFALSSSLVSEDWRDIVLGPNCRVSNSNFSLEEFVLWNEIIDPTSVALVGGTGSLNGASRTAFVDVASLNGSSYTDPGIANVKTGTSYTYNGTSLTGTYTGSDRWTDPGVANVIEGVAYKADSTTNNRTGTYHEAQTSEVQQSITFGPSSTYTGTYSAVDNDAIATAVLKKMFSFSK